MLHALSKDVSSTALEWPQPLNKTTGWRSCIDLCDIMVKLAFLFGLLSRHQ